MKLKLFFIYILLSFICIKSEAQKFLNQGCYWPNHAPNQPPDPSPRRISDSTSEDWWYDFKALPLNHPAYNTDSGRYICVGYSGFDDIGLGNFYTNDPCNSYGEINFNDPFNYSNFDLPDMRHMNTSGTIGLINLSRTSTPANPNKWIYHYGQGTSFLKVIPTSDGGFLATGRTTAINLPYPSNEPQFVNFQNPANSPQPIYYQYPSNATVNPFGIDAFPYTSCPTNHTAMFPVEPPGRPIKKPHACLYKVNSAGILEWCYVYGTVPFDNTNQGIIAYKNSSLGTDLVETSNGYILAGIMQNSTLNGNLGNHGFLLKVNTDGMLQWIKEYNDVDLSRGIFTAITLQSDTVIYVTGERTNMTFSPHSGYPNSSSYLNGNDFADKEHHGSMRFIPFLKKINISTAVEIWDFPLETDPEIAYKVRDLAINVNNNILVPVSTECVLSFPQGECKNSYVNKIVDNGTSATSIQKTYFGPIRAFDLDTGLGIEATADGGFVVVGTKKAYNLNIAKDYSLPINGGNGYNMGGFAQAYAQTDAFVAKCNAAGNIEWTSIFDNKAPGGGGNIFTINGNPRNQTNLDSWMNFTTTRSKKDIKRQECLYAIATSTTGEIIVGGNMSSNIDDSYLAMVENTCDLNLSNHLIQAINSLSGTPLLITNMDNFVASNINTGRIPGNTNEVAEFIVNNAATIKMEAGQEINMYDGTDLDAGTDVDAYINPSHNCTSGPVYAYIPYTPSFGRSEIVKDKKTFLPANVKSQIIASPNPTTGLVTIKHPTAIKQFEVFDRYGKTIFKIRANGSGQTNVDFTNMPAGMYLLRMENMTEAIKIVKQ